MAQKKAPRGGRASQPRGNEVCGSIVAETLFHVNKLVDHGGLGPWH